MVLSLRILLRLLLIGVSALYYQRVLGEEVPYRRMLLSLVPVMGAFQIAYWLWPVCDLLSSSAQPMLSGCVAILETAATIAVLRLITKSRWAQILLFYSLALLVSVLSSLLLFALSALFTGTGIATLAATQWNDFFSSFISAALQMGLLIAIAEAIAHYARKQPTELRFSQFAPVLGAQAASAVVLIVLMRESGLYARMLPALAVLLLLYCIADIVLISAFRAFVKNSELAHEVRSFQQMQALQKTYYQSLEKQFQDARRMRHDYKNVLQTMDLLLAKGEAEKARGLAAECYTTLDSGSVVYTGHDILDAVLNSKASDAKNAGIRFLAELTLPEPLRVSDTDVMGVFANLLDNAIEYAAGLPQENERLVGVTGMVRAGLWILTFFNTFGGGIPPSFITTKADRKLHGYGMGIVQSIVQKYGGTMATAVKSCQLTITITLNTALEKCEG